MNTTELKNQLKSILEVEQKIREQNEFIEETTNKMSSLGIPNQKMTPPQPTKLKYKPGLKSIVNYLILDIVVLISLIGNLSLFADILTTLLDIDTDIIIKGVLIIVFLAIAAVPWIISYIKFTRNQKILDKQYKDLVVQYNSMYLQDQKRVELELLQKASLQAQINNANDQKEHLKHVCEKLYEFGGIRQEYRNFDAVKHIYEYLDKERTYGLTYNPQTGDRGAYDIYDSELILRKTLLSVKELLISQEDIVDGMESAEEKINEMSTNLITYFSHSLSYQKATLDSALRTEAYSAKTAADTSKIKRDTRKNRRNTDKMNRRDSYRFWRYDI